MSGPYLSLEVPAALTHILNFKSTTVSVNFLYRFRIILMIRRVNRFAVRDIYELARYSCRCNSTLRPLEECDLLQRFRDVASNCFAITVFFFPLTYPLAVSRSNWCGSVDPGEAGMKELKATSRTGSSVFSNIAVCDNLDNYLSSYSPSSQTRRRET